MVKDSLDIPGSPSQIPVLLNASTTPAIPRRPTPTPLIVMGSCDGSGVAGSQRRVPSARKLKQGVKSRGSMTRYMASSPTQLLRRAPGARKLKQSVELSGGMTRNMTSSSTQLLRRKSITVLLNMVRLSSWIETMGLFLGRLARRRGARQRRQYRRPMPR